MMAHTLLPKIRVLDLSRVQAGPWATQMLADFGADVIKVERPGSGDESRAQGPKLKDRDGQPTADSSVFLALNRNKRSIAIDIARPEGQALVRELAQQVDVVIENFKAGDLARYGLDQASLRALNPRLIYCSISGFGQSGPYSHLPGYDLVFQAMSGLMSITGIPEGQPGAGPQRAGYPVADITSGFYAVTGILAALHHRDTVSGEGQYIDLGMLEAQVAAMANMAMSYVASGVMPQRVGTRSQLVCPYQDFECADGTLMIAVGNDGQYRALCAQALERPDLADDPRYASSALRVANRETLVPEIARILAGNTLAHWMARLRAANVPSGPINTFAQIMADPQMQHRQMMQTMPHTLAGEVPVIGNPLKFSSTPVQYRRGPPLLGEHTGEVLHDMLAMDEAAVAALKQQGVIA